MSTDLCLLKETTYATGQTKHIFFAQKQSLSCINGIHTNENVALRSFWFTVVLLLCGVQITSAAWATPPTSNLLIVQATLVELPKSSGCEGRNLVRVTTRYRLEAVLQGPLSSAEKYLLVVHRCPELPRGASRQLRGTALRLRPGQSHRLTLRPLDALEGVHDRFPHEKALRYEALITDPASAPPRVIVTISGGAGAQHSLEFFTPIITVGRATDSDILLDDSTVCWNHAQLEVIQEQIIWRDRHPDQETRLNNQLLRAPRPLSRKDEISLGAYTLQVKLILPTSSNPAAE